MGFSQSWIAIALPRTEARALFKVRPTGQRSEFAELTLSDAILPNGGYLIVANECDWAERQNLQQLSREGELVAASVEEHVMVSWASCWRDGNLVWRIAHDSQISEEHLEVTGELPTGYREIADELLEKQKTLGDCDYLFDIPVMAAKLTTDYRHDEDGPWSEDEPFEILEKIEPVRPWWRFW
ncbi:MAG: hypothetical protein U0930_22245 [Pirellulales bacterium]